jgi:hypothetical protein
MIFYMKIVSFYTNTNLSKRFYVYLPMRLRNARVLFINFLCLCLFIFNLRFRSTLVAYSVGRDDGVDGTVGGWKGLRVAMY